MTTHFFRSCLAVIAALALMLVSSMSLAGLELPPRNLKQGMNAAPPPPPPPPRQAPPPPSSSMGDPCTGASSAQIKTIAPPRFAGAAAARDVGIKGVSPYPGSGNGPIPDVTNWQPRGRIASGDELVIQGRNLIPGQFVAMIGNVRLTPTTQSASEIRFRGAQATAGGGESLVVYHNGGQPRTLEQTYLVVDGNVAITKVVPTTFGQGDMVTVCGSGLFQIFLDDIYTERNVVGIPPMSSLTTAPGKFVGIGDNAYAQKNGNLIMIYGATVSPSGDRLTFRAGDLYTHGVACRIEPCRSGNEGLTDFLMPATPQPPSFSGPLTIRLQGVNQALHGPTVTWQLGGPRVTAVYGKLFGVKEPFVILPSPSAPMLLAQAYADGANLDNVSWKIGAMPISGGARGGTFTNNQSGMPNDGTFAILSIPLNASNGPVCGTLNGKTACAPTPLQVFGAPEITRMPAMPLALYVNHTIEGVNLLPPAIPGLTYHFDMFGTAPSSTTTACNQVLEVIQHTATRIVFRIGDPAKTAPIPNGCDQGAMFTAPPPGSSSAYSANIFASYTGGSGVGMLKPIPFYLKPESVPKIVKFEARSALGTVLSNTNMDVVKSALGSLYPLNLGSGQSATLTWDLGTTPYDSADITPDVGPLTGTTGSKVVSPTSTKRYVLTVKKGPALVQSGIDIVVGTPPTIASFYCMSIFTPPPSDGISYYIKGTQGELRWSVDYGWTSIDITPGPVYTKTRALGSTNTADSGSVKVNPGISTIYTISAKNQNGESKKSCTLAELPSTKIAEFSVTPATIKKGESATLTWRVEGLAEKVFGRMTPSFFPSGSSTLPSVTGSIIIKPIVTQNITLEANGYDNLQTPISKTINIQVTP